MKRLISILIIISFAAIVNKHAVAEPNKIYWTIPSHGEIQRANLDGTNIEVLISGLNYPRRRVHFMFVGK